MGHRICIMNKGEVVQIGRPLDVYRAPADTFVARFLGSPPMNLLRATPRRQGSGFSLEMAGQTLPVHNYDAGVLAPFADREIIAGIRPEDIYEAAGQHDFTASAAISATILVAEPLGAETLLVLSLPGQGEECVARVSRDCVLRHGERAAFLFDATTIHLFDPQTTKALPRAATSGE